MSVEQEVHNTSVESEDLLALQGVDMSNTQAVLDALTSLYHELEASLDRK